MRAIWSVLAALLFVGTIMGGVAIAAPEATTPEYSGNADTMVGPAAPMPHEYAGGGVESPGAPADGEKQPLNSIFNGARFFEENQGQFGEESLWVTRGSDVMVAIVPQGLRFIDAEGELVELFVEGAQATNVVALETLTSTTTIIGETMDDSVVGATHASKVRLVEVLPSIHMDVYFTDAGQIEYDFVVLPGADPTSIRLVSNEEITLSENGALVGAADVHAPVSMQDGVLVPSQFTLTDGKLGFQVGDYDPTRTLVIDPILDYATYIKQGSQNPWVIGYSYAYDVNSRETSGVWGTTGYMYMWQGNTNQHITQNFGSGGFYQGFIISFDEDNELRYFTLVSAGTYAFLNSLDFGNTNSVYTGGYVFGNAPTPGGTFTTNPGGYSWWTARWEEVVDPSTGQMSLDLKYAELLGSQSYDYLRDVAVNDKGEWAAVGTTYYCPANAANFPMVNAKRGYPAMAGTSTCKYTTAAVVKFSNQDSIEYSDTLGGTCYNCAGTPYASVDYLQNVDIDPEGNVWTGGYTNSEDLPTKNGLYMTPLGSGYDHYITKLDRNDNIVYMTYWGTTGNDYSYYGVPIKWIEGDEVVWGGTVYGSAVPQTVPRPSGPGSSYDGYIAHFDFAATNLIFGWQFGGTSSDYVTGVGYNKDANTYTVGGFAYMCYYNTVYWKEFADWAKKTQVPQDECIKSYSSNDGFIIKIAPDKADPTQPLTENEAMIDWATYYGGYYWQYLYSVEEHKFNGDVLFAGYGYGFSWGTAPYYKVYTTPDALDRDPGYYYNGFVGRIKKAPPIPWVVADDGYDSAESPINAPPPDPMMPDGTLVTQTWTDVYFQADAIATEMPVNRDTFRWDMDGDGEFDDWPPTGGVWQNVLPYWPAEPLVWYDQGMQQVCVRVDDDDPGNIATGERCIWIDVKNRPPVPVIRTLNDPPLTRLEPVRLDASQSFDLDGEVIWETIEWDYGGTGYGNDGSGAVTTLFQYDTVGPKEVQLTLYDDDGDPATRLETIEIVNLDPEVTCKSTGKPMRVGGWFEMNTDGTNDRDGDITRWELDVQGLQPGTFSGEGEPPRILRTSDLTGGGVRFTEEGDFTAVLTVWDNDFNVPYGKEWGRTQCVMEFIVEPEQVIADFLWSNPTWTGFDINFDGRPSYAPNGIIIDYSWEFGNGAKDNGEQVIHVFDEPGVYPVTLTVYDGKNTDFTTREVTVVDPPIGPSVGFDVSQGPHFEGKDVFFVDKSSLGEGDLDSLTWDFTGPDGWTKTRTGALGGTISQAFPEAGTYEVKLTFAEEDGNNGWVADTSVVIEVIEFKEALADFTASNTRVTVGEEVIFKDATTPGVYELVAWEWTMGDGSGLRYGEDQKYVFKHPGNYLVTMTVMDETEARFYAQHTIEVVPIGDDGGEIVLPPVDPRLPTADAGPDRSVLAGSVVKLDGTASSSVTVEPLSFKWRQVAGPSVEIIGADTATPSIQVPFLNNANSIVILELIVADEIGTSLPDALRIFVQQDGADNMGVLAEPDAEFEAGEGAAGAFVFTAPPQSSEKAKFLWDFGDGNMGTGAKAQHVYNEPGIYEVTLTVIDEFGREETFTYQVEVGNPYSDPTQRVYEEPGLFSSDNGGLLWGLIIAGVLVGALLLVGAVLVARRR